MTKAQVKENIIHLLAIGIFAVLAFTYFSPLLGGKVLKQGDNLTYLGAAKEIMDHRQQYGEEPLWSNSMFGGMPSYLTSAIYPNDCTRPFAKILNLGDWQPANHLFLYMLCFYIALLAFRVDPRLAIVGGIAYGLSSYFLIIIEAGHITKAYAIGYMPMVIASVWLAFKRKPVLGALLFSLFLAFQMTTRHLQITYYTFLVIGFFGVVLVADKIIEKQFKQLVKVMGLLAAGLVLAAGINFSNLYLVNEYGKESMRGTSELTQHNKNVKTSGLDKDYATAWSYGKAETWTLLVPNIMGGGASDNYTYSGAHEEMTKMLTPNYGETEAKNVASQVLKASYWGDQPFTSGPVYVGAIICFLFILGLMLVNGPLKWAILLATILSIFLAWGKNMMWFTDIWFDYIPGYNKFRTVSMTLVIAEFTFPLLAILAVDRILKGEVSPSWQKLSAKAAISKNELANAVIWAFIITGGLTLIFALFNSAFFNFGPDKIDSNIPKEWHNQILDARQSLLRSDAFRSFLFILLAAGVLYAFALRKIKHNIMVALLGVLVLFDLWSVARRYLNNDSFVSKAEMATPYQPTNADKFILSDNTDKARVLNLAANTFNDASTSYFHQSIGGYHGAKMKRYQELIDLHIVPEIQKLYGVFQANPTPEAINAVLRTLPAINMLNTKYIIYNGEAQPLKNPYSNGPAWFVSENRMVVSADAEIEVLKNTDTKIASVIDQRFADLVKGAATTTNASDYIKRTSYKANDLVYEYQLAESKVAVFSEIYYSKGWNAYVDGQLTPHFRADYVLRAMKLPAGKHTVEFKFEPEGFKIGSIVMLISSLLLLLLIAGYVVDHVRRREKAIQ